jgi:hypothetical protein
MLEVSNCAQGDQKVVVALRRSLEIRKEQFPTCPIFPDGIICPAPE